MASHRTSRDVGPPKDVSFTMVGDLVVEESATPFPLVPAPGGPGLFGVPNAGAGGGRGRGGASSGGRGAGLGFGRPAGAQGAGGGGGAGACPASPRRGRGGVGAGEDEEGDEPTADDLSTARHDYDDDICDVCRGGESLDQDVLLSCERCEVWVHQSCYGVTRVPKGEWYVKLGAWGMAVRGGGGGRGGSGVEGRREQNCRFSWGGGGGFV